MTTFLSLYNLFSNIPLVYPIFFFYGAAFLFLGISISVKELKASDLKLSQSLWMLGMFGFVHGFHEWLQLLPLIQGEYITRQEIFLIKLILLSMIILSFFFLLQFGLSLISALDKKQMNWIKWVPSMLVLLWSVVLWKNRSHLDLLFLWHTKVGVRYTLGLTGGLVTGYGLITYSYEIKKMSEPVSRNFLFSGIAILFYGLFEGIIDLRTLLTIIHVPVEFLRGVSVFLFSYFIIKALNIFDIETRLKIEQQTRLLVQTEKLSSLGQLAAGIAHEINNPLTNASLGIQTLKARLKSNEELHQTVEKLDAIERNIDRASVIAQELLQFARQREAEFVPLNINSIISSTLTLLGYKLTNINLKQDLVPVPEVMGDRGKLEQVLINVLSNSLEAMPEGGSIFISSSQINSLIEVRVTDTGMGITAESLSRVFDPFFTTKEIGSGTGLGLSICYGIIKQHHGHIELSSVVGRGTTTTIKIPTREQYEKDTDCRR
jgi:two-component system, NtrC family, sensor kinase